jgi:addiction module RelE/StbE family toxin
VKIIRTNPFKRDFQKLPDHIKKRIAKTLKLLIENPYHPSLRVKKIKGEIIKGFDDVFEARISKDYRLFFLIELDCYVLLRCGSHEAYLK